MNSKSVKEFIRKEVPYIINLLSRMEDSRGNTANAEFFIDGYEIPYLSIENFVLPDRFAKNGHEDHEDIIIFLPNFPSTPPNGVYVPTDSPHLEEIKTALGGHVYGHNYNAMPEDSFDEVHTDGYTWVCFHYENNIWHYDFDNPMKGDCLCKYIETVFLALDGKYIK